MAHTSAVKMHKTPFFFCASLQTYSPSIDSEFSAVYNEGEIVKGGDSHGSV